jgi:hypothetical protein
MGPRWLRWAALAYALLTVAAVAYLLVAWRGHVLPNP